MTEPLLPLLTKLGNVLTSLTPENPDALDGLRRNYHPTITFRDPIQQVRGIEKFVALNDRLLRRMKKLEWVIRSGRGDESEAFLEWTMRGRPKFGPAIALDGVTRVQAIDGKIVDHRDFWDMGEMIASSIPGGIHILHALRKPMA